MEKIGITALFVYVLFVLALWAGIGYVAYHFITKFW